MEKPRIDFLKQKYELGYCKKNNLLVFRRYFAIVIVLCAVIGSVFSYHVTSTNNSTGDFPKLSVISTLRHFIDRSGLKGEENDRVNILLLGIGGEEHEGPQLTDTIIFASYQPSTKKIALMSLPRDMSVPIPGYGYRKANHANAFGELEKSGYGPKLASQVIGDVLNQEINYYVRVDFDGFAKLIDDIGGVDIYVDNGFTDPDYPINGRELDTCGNDMDVNTETTTDTGGDTTTEKTSADYSCRFEVLTFQEGWEHMDGDVALQFVRSRHGTNGEGSDFARSARQQKVLLAVKDKIMSASTYLNPARINRIIDTLSANIVTNLDASDILRLAQNLKDFNKDQITNIVVDTSPDSPLYATILNGSYVLLPKNDDWEPLQDKAEFIFNPNAYQTRFTDANEDKPRFVKVEIQNGTNLTGLAFNTSQLLDGHGFDVVKVGNAASREYKHTVIYDLTNGERAAELKALRDFLKADVTLSATGWMISGEIVPKGISVTSEDYQKLATESNIDFLVILGEDSLSVAKN